MLFLPRSIFSIRSDYVKWKLWPQEIICENFIYLVQQAPCCLICHFSSKNYSGLVPLSGEGNGTPLQYFCLDNPGRLQSMGLLESDTTERVHFHFSFSCIREGNGNPLQYSCLENPRPEEPSGLPSMGSHRVGHDWSDLAAAAAAASQLTQKPKFSLMSCKG